MPPLGRIARLLAATLLAGAALAAGLALALCARGNGVGPGALALVTVPVALALANARLAGAERWAADSRERGAEVTLRVLEGDHFIALLRPLEIGREVWSWINTDLARAPTRNERGCPAPLVLRNVRPRAASSCAT